MEGIGTLIWIFFIIIAVVSSSKKAKQKQQAGKTKTGPIQGQSAPARATSNPVNTMEQVRFSGNIPEGTDPCHEADLGGPDRMRSMLYGGSFETYPGSLGSASEEGIDPCHEDQASAMTLMEVTGDSDEAGNPVTRFDWSGNEILKAVVMQEILKRPGERAVR